ncbi:MAG: NADH-quinone oxidoreductase subunit J [Acidobacteria bacterium]|nr:NADH-quinone oxidoreductase subunit J [Acidobacteriota bacterium]
MRGTSPRYRYGHVMRAWVFWGLAAVCVVAALLVVGQRSAVRGIQLLAVLLAAVGGLYLLLAAPLAAFLQIAMLVGIVLAIVLPVILFLDLPDEIDDGVDVGPGSGSRRLGVVLAAVFVVEVAWAFQRVRGATLPADHLVPAAGPFTMALRAVSEYTPGFALAAMLIVATVLGVLVLIRREAR